MIHSVWLFLLATIQNPSFLGIVSASVIGSGAWALRKLPEALWGRFLSVSSHDFRVSNDTTGFEWFERWLMRQKYTESYWCRSFRLTIEPSETIEHNDYVKLLAPGLGTHFMWYKGFPVTVTRWQDEAGVGVLKKREGFDFRIFFAPRRLLQEVIDEAEKASKEAIGRVPLMVWVDGWWTKAPALRPRNLDTVYLPDSLVEHAMEDVKQFVASSDWYVERGIPYRRGYLLAGNPGSGKTTLAIAIASYLKRPVYVVALANISDSNLSIASMSLPRNAILLLEDVDTVKQTETRGKKDKAVVVETDKSSQLSLGGLLNALDGVFASEGRIVIMTTNHPDNLDPALVRPGRADYRLDFPLADADVMAAMFEKFYSGYGASPVLFEGVKPLAPALVQGILLTNRDRPAQALAALKEAA